MRYPTYFLYVYPSIRKLLPCKPNEAGNGRLMNIVFFNGIIVQNTHFMIALILVIAFYINYIVFLNDCKLYISPRKSDVYDMNEG